MKDPLNNNLNDNWINNPKLADIDKTKLEMLRSLASQGNTKGAGANSCLSCWEQPPREEKRVRTSAPVKISTIIDVLKAGKSPQEIQKLDKVVQLMKMIR